MGLKIITPPTVSPIEVIGLDAIKSHLQEALDVSDNDSAISALTAAAWDLAERQTWRQFLTASYRLTLETFRAQAPDRNGNLCPVLIPRAPTQSIESVKYKDATDGTLTTLTVDDDYIIDDESAICSIRPAYDTNWPGVRWNDPQAVQIEFTAGYGDTLEDMPPVLIHAIKLQVGDWWRYRESTVLSTPSVLSNSAKALLESIEIRDDRLS